MVREGTRRSLNAQALTSIKHSDKRANIPTEELRDFVEHDATNPEVATYPRDPSLDPQLVWRKKDELDQADLEVPVVPIYIQERIHPQALIEDLISKSKGPEQVMWMFSDFNGGPQDFEKKIDFYHHEQKWTNRLILGDSLLIMSSLSTKEGLKGKVQTIYIDPPYGIRFGSNWQVSTRKKDVKDGRVEDTTRQPEQIKAYRDTWELGIHSYLSYLRDRIAASRDLLTDSGSLFIQIGDENVHLVRSLVDEVFGSDNFMSLITVRKTSPLGANALPNISDYIIWYAKSKDHVKYRQLYIPKEFGGDSLYRFIELEDGTRRRMTIEEKKYPERIPKDSRPFRLDNLQSSGYTQSCTYDFEFKGEVIKARSKSWLTNKDGMQRLIAADRLMQQGKIPAYVRYYDDFPVMPLNNLWNDTASAGDIIYVVQSASKPVERCILMTSDPGDLIFDPTCGSGTTAVAAEKWGRRWITCDTSRVAVAIARTRLMSARFPFFVLADSPEGRRKEEELQGRTIDNGQPGHDIRKGFTYRRVPHVTAKSIAQNPDISEGLPRQRIKEAIDRFSEQEVLVDNPFEDSKKVRVCGPFSVESLSPHRVLSFGDSDSSGSVSEQEAQDQIDFVSMILDNLKRSGVQNSIKEERLTFARIDPYAGQWINAVGHYQDLDGSAKRAAIAIGPEHGTVGPSQVKEAAKEAVQGIGFDVLLVCGFAFDPHVAEEAKRYGKLTVLPTKINPDLAMGEELLKKTGAGNLFTVFGEPDITVDIKGNECVVELHGLDLYDPTTSQVRSSSVDDIACWFLDTSYNGESFFVRHAYFTGADKPYERLKKTLRVEVSEEAWAALYRTKSRPFPVPDSGKIAVKVINHYGDEVLKVFTLNSFV
jgi:adenine-specific DNA-methyltransferase